MGNETVYRVFVQGVNQGDFTAVQCDVLDDRSLLIPHFFSVAREFPDLRGNEGESAVFSVVRAQCETLLQKFKTQTDLYHFLSDYYDNVEKVMRAIPSYVLRRTVVEKEEIISAQNVVEAFVKVGSLYYVDNLRTQSYIYHVSRTAISPLKTLDGKVLGVQG